MMEQKSSLDQTSSESFFFFNPRTPCDPTCRTTIKPAGCFNPRTPCGVRHTLPAAPPRLSKFQSTHSLRSATPTGDVETIMETVSIHALLAECDPSPVPRKMSSMGFNPRTPCGVRPYSSVIYPTGETFQSTHSLRSATFTNSMLKLPTKVSIHALLAECDRPR